MALLNRVSQLFKADFNAVLDQIEEPEQILKQAVRDMEDELAASENRIAVCSLEQETLAQRRKEVSASVSELDAELDLCFESGKEELARSAVRRKLQAVRQVKNLDAQLQTNDRFIRRERGLLEENRATLEGLRQKAELFVCSTPTDERSADVFIDHAFSSAVSEDEVEIAFLREQASRGES